MQEKTVRARYRTLDELRGAAIIFMVIYHALYLLSSVFESAAGRKIFTLAHPVQPFIAGTFILICGICCQLSRSNWKRGLRLLGAALLVSLCTWAMKLVGMDEVITFGVLHFLAVAVLLFALSQILWIKLSLKPALLLFIVFLFLFAASVLPLYKRDMGFGFISTVLRFPKTDFFPLFALGFPSSTLSSADYFPLIPWLFLFFAGAALGAYARQGRFPVCFTKSRVPALQWLGRHSLLIYLLHQPVLYALLSLALWLKKII